MDAAQEWLDKYSILCPQSPTYLRISHNTCKRTQTRKNGEYVSAAGTVLIIIRPAWCSETCPYWTQGKRKQAHKRVCPACGGAMVRRVNESRGQFKKRATCSFECGRAYHDWSAIGQKGNRVRWERSHEEEVVHD